MVNHLQTQHPTAEEVRHQYTSGQALRARQDQLIIPREDISIQIPKKGRQLIILTLLLTGLAGPLSDTLRMRTKQQKL